MVYRCAYGCAFIYTVVQRDLIDSRSIFGRKTDLKDRITIHKNTSKKNIKKFQKTIEKPRNAWNNKYIKGKDKKK